MDAVQRERKKARDYGYLRNNAQIIVSGGPYITIVPVHHDRARASGIHPGAVL
jgi:hypothetical protein